MRVERSFSECANLIRKTVQPEDCIGRKYIGLEHIEEGTLRLIGEGQGKDVTSIKSEFQAGDILFGKLRPYFRKVIRPDFDGVCSTDIWVVRAGEGIEQSFLYYLMASSDFVDLATRGSKGTKMPRADWDFVSQSVFPVPPLPIQRRIAHILGSLDDKIELNRRMNRTLEKMAAAIFKSWFIDFDPVRAKAEGLDTGLPPEIAELFPDAFEESKLGEIPKGWEVGPFSRIAILHTKTVHPGDFPNKFWEHYSIPAYDEGRHPRWERGDTIKSGKYQVPKNSILASKLNPQFPRIWLPDMTDTDISVCSTEFMPFVPIRDEWRPYLYELIKSSVFQEGIKARVTGSTGSRQRVNPKDIAEMKLILPHNDVIVAFSRVAYEIHKRLMSNQNNSLSLARTRDCLLPSLLNGDMDITTVEV